LERAAAVAARMNHISAMMHASDDIAITGTARRGRPRFVAVSLPKWWAL
jgi:hypothetical protein